MPFIESEPQFAGFVDVSPDFDEIKEEGVNELGTVTTHAGGHIEGHLQFSDRGVGDLVRCVDEDIRERRIGLSHDTLIKHQVSLVTGNYGSSITAAITAGKIDPPSAYHIDLVYSPGEYYRYTWSNNTSTDCLAGRFFVASTRSFSALGGLASAALNSLLVATQARRALWVRADNGQITRLEFGSTVHRYPKRNQTTEDGNPSLLIIDNAEVVK